MCCVLFGAGYQDKNMVHIECETNGKAALQNIIQLDFDIAGRIYVLPFVQTKMKYRFCVINVWIASEVRFLRSTVGLQRGDIEKS